MSDNNGAPKEAPSRSMERRVVPDPPGLIPSGQIPPHGGVSRTDFFSKLKAPMENGTGKAPATGKR